MLAQKGHPVNGGGDAAGLQSESQASTPAPGEHPAPQPLRRSSPARADTAAQTPLP